LTPSLISCS